MIIFDDAPVAKRAGMSVFLGQSLGQAEQSARQSIERAQTSAMARISRTLGYEVQAETPADPSDQCGVGHRAV